MMSMAKPFSSPMAMLSVFSFFLFFSSQAMAGAGPFIVAHKRVALKRLSSGGDFERVSVSIDIYNSGSVPAYDVSLTDDTWDQEVFDSVIGNTSKSWEKLDAGSLVSHTFELESRMKTIYHSAPAKITYRVLTKSRLQEAYSTPVLPLKILSDTAKAKKIDVAKKLLQKYGSHFSVVLILILLAGTITTPSKSSAATRNKRRH